MVSPSSGAGNWIVQTKRLPPRQRQDLAQRSLLLEGLREMITSRQFTLVS